MFALVAQFRADSEEPDSYSISVVKKALKMRAGGQIFISSQTQKYISRLGDAVSIALLKILGEQELMNPESIESFLPIVRDSFDQPQMISIESDKQPKVTLFLLNHLKQDVPDVRVREDIQQTIDFVKSKTADGGQQALHPR